MPTETQDKKEEQELPFKVNDFKFQSHMNMSNCGIRVDAGVIEWPGNPIDGKTICRQIYTKKTKMGGWGKGKASFFISEDKSPEFDSIQKFAEHYAVPIAPEPTIPPDPPLVKLKPEALKRRQKPSQNNDNQ